MLKSVPHDSAHGHVTGEAEYIDDRPLMQGELHVGFLGSPIASGLIESVDLSQARKIEGVVGLYTAKDIPGKNLWGTIFKDQPLLVETEASFVGHPVVVIAADSRETIAKASQAIQLKIKEQKPVLSIDEAIAKKMFIGPERTIERGNIENGFAGADHILEDVFENNGQEHFYLESQAAIAYPQEKNCMEVHASSQHPTEVQHVVADFLGLNCQQVVCIVKRMGGGFGGKESQNAPIAAMAALAAFKTKRPARMVLEVDQDMSSTGKRHPFKLFYKIGFNKNGKIAALQANLFSNGGAFADLSTSIMERAMFHSENAYYIPNVKITGQACRTHLPPNTAFRGFGGPQGVAMIENAMEEIALILKKDPSEIRRLNCYGVDKNNITPYGQKLENNTLPKLFDQIYETSNYDQRRQEIFEFNQTSKTHLKGISLTAVKFGISFTTLFLNQGNAMVAVHRDGTIQATTGATEMGQGVNTKIAQVIADCFGIEPNRVSILATRTDKNPNTSPTAASSGTDLNAAAARLACDKIKHRLSFCADQVLRGNRGGQEGQFQMEPHFDGSPFCFKNGEVFDSRRPDKKIRFKDLLPIALNNRISLADFAHYKFSEIYFSKEKFQGHPFLYFSNGTAVSEVLIDRFTGETKVLAADILMDLGEMINYGIDYGQTVGGFIQCMGWVTTEEVYFDNRGVLQAHSPTTYKIPNIQDTPRRFKIDFLKNDTNAVNILRSKASGEPPFLLGISVWTAVKQALSFVNPKKIPKIKLPATPEEILLCLTKLTPLK